MIRETFPLILASASPRRQDLLRSVGIPFQIVPSQTDESLRTGEEPEEHVLRLARAKASEVSSRNRGRWVLAADTVVVLDGKVLGKPKDRKEAEEMLRELSQRVHRVTTAYCILNSSPTLEVTGKVTTPVTFKALSSEEIRWYLDTGEPFDKAGGYAIQGKGSFMVKEIHGSYTNVVGLPLGEVLGAFQELGIWDFGGSS